MNKVIVAMLLLGKAFSMSSLCYAYEIESNPDRYVSFALDYEGGRLSGDSNLDILLGTNLIGVYAGGNGPLDESTKVVSFRPSLRLPVTSSLSLDIHANVLKQDFEHKADGFTWTGTQSGTLWGAGIRWYMK